MMITCTPKLTKALTPTSTSFKLTVIASVCLTLLTSVSLSAHAALPATPPPDSGSLLQQNKPLPPVTPSANNTGLVIESQTSSNLPASAPFMVSKINIEGNTQFDNATLHALVADAEGHEQTLQQLGQVIARLTNYYHSHGYPLARAYIPAQTMQDGVVRVAIVEARYGQVHLVNHSLVSDSVLQSSVANLISGHQVEQAQLDRTLLLVSDIPGVSATSLIRPGEAVGTSDLVLQAQATPVWSGNAVVDNYGNRYTGKARLGGSFYWIDPTHSGDILSINALTTGKDMNSVGVTYETLMSGNGVRVGGSASTLRYTLGDSLSNIGGHGTADVGSIWIKYPWQRSLDVNVYSQIQYDYKKLNDDIDSVGIQNNRHSDSGSVSLNGDVRDKFLAGAVTTWSVSWKAGELRYDNAAAQTVDAQSAKTQGGFFKWTGNYARLQNLTDSTAVFAAISAQYANGNLDSSEKMVAGGAYSVRGYDMGAASGDSGILGNLELRHNLGDWGSLGQWQAVAFVDSEKVTINTTTWAAGSNVVNISSAGAGLNWSNNSGWHAKLFVAAPIKSKPDLITEHNSTHTWAEIGAWF